MRQTFIVAGALVLLLLCAVVGLGQPDPLQGRWEGTSKSFQGERSATVILKKEADGYSGTITGMQGTIPLKELKVAGDQLTARSEVDTPQAGRLTFNYKFAIQGETLKGTGAVEVGGQSYDFTLDLKRVSTSTAPTPQEERRTRPSAPPTVQKQSLDYFVGQWSFKWIGRESALGVGGRREGTTIFKFTPGGQTLESATEGRSDEGSYQETAIINFDGATKLLSVVERRRDLTITSKADWTSPLAIRFTVEPIKLKDRTLHLRRTIAILSAYSFTVTEELSEDGGPFVRLGQAIFSKANTSGKAASPEAGLEADWGARWLS